MKKLILLLLPLASLPMLARAADVPENWAKNCAACHGKDGKGATKAGRMAGVKDFTDAAYQATFTDDQAAASIKNGVKNAQGTEKMKPFGEKLTDDEIKALVDHIRGLGK